MKVTMTKAEPDDAYTAPADYEILMTQPPGAGWANGKLSYSANNAEGDYLRLRLTAEEVHDLKACLSRRYADG